MRLDEYFRMLKGSKEHNLRRVLAWGSFQWGVSRKVCANYLSILQDLGMIVIDEALDMIFVGGGKE